MQTWLIVWLSLICFSGFAAAPPSPTAKPAEAYVRFTQWCRANGLQAAWIKKEKVLQATKPGTRLVFNIESRETSVNGVQVWMLLPLIYRDNSPLISELDARLTFPPLFNPPKLRKGAKIRTICLDPGHGGKDPGNQVGGRQEKAFTLLLAQELRDQLRSKGFNVVMTRSTDAYIDLATRPEMAKRRDADLFVSLHFNAAASNREFVRGSEVYCLTPASAASTNSRGDTDNAGSFPGNRHDSFNLQAALQVQRELIRVLGVPDRGVRRARFAVLREATMPAVLIEAGFMSHPEESKRIFDSTYRRTMARAIVAGLLNYKRIVEQAS